MAKHYGTTPSRLLERDVGSFSIDLECWQADLREQEREHQKALRKQRQQSGHGRSLSPPEWPT